MVAFVISFHGDYVGWQSTGGGRVFAAGSGEDWPVGELLTDCAQGWAVRKQ